MRCFLLLPVLVTTCFLAGFSAEAASKLKLFTKTITMYEGEIVWLDSEYSGYDEPTYSWNSNKSSVASVSYPHESYTLIFGNKPGKAVIKVKAGKYTAKCTVKVKALPKTGSAGTKEKAIKAYKSLLSKKTFKVDDFEKISLKNVYFTLCYINNDNIPELYIESRTIDEDFSFKSGYLFTYYNNKVIRLDQGRDFNEEPFRYWARTGIYRISEMWDGTATLQSYCELTHGRKKHLLVSGGETDSLWAYGKEVSLSVYMKKLSVITKGKKKAEIKYRKNTAANRKKYLK